LECFPLVQIHVLDNTCINGIEVLELQNIKIEFIPYLPMKFDGKVLFEILPFWALVGHLR
jgi:hypothetical protein